jgi:hypothetical protein
VNFTNVAWWAYAIAAAVGLSFGFFQSRLVKWATMGEHPRKWLYAVKFGLWALALIGFALISLPLLVVFVAVGSLSLLVSSALIYRKAQREAR